MYNRYVPQSDGSFRKNRVPGSQRPQEERPQPGPPPPPPLKKEPCAPPPAVSAGSFLRQLIPKNLDTGDLLIIVLLLLMAGDREEEKNNALLTLALYLFL